MMSERRTASLEPSEPPIRISFTIVLLVSCLGLACTAPGSSEPAEAIGSSPVSAAEQLDEAPEGLATDKLVPSRRGQSVIESEELIGLGELGLLPSLFQTLGTGIDCDFDDALSTCQ